MIRCFKPEKSVTNLIKKDSCNPRALDNLGIEDLKKETCLSSEQKSGLCIYLKGN
jgi:hypothetical protein